LQDKFLFLYAGNMGYTSALEEVILAADLLRDRPDIRFSLVGEGVYKDRLQQLTADLRLENVLFLPYQPRADLAELMSAADVSLVSLNPGASQFSMPNKVFSIMSSGRPVLAITPLDSELARLIFDTGCGLVVPPGGAQQLADTIREMTGDPVGNTEMGRRGRERMMKEFSRTPCVEDFDVLLAELVR
jgi:colanic acid biosynthesis glycosyl transferase WcaI